MSLSVAPAAITRPTPEEHVLSGFLTARATGAVQPQLDALSNPSKAEWVIDGAQIEALDTAGAWVLKKLLRRLRDDGSPVRVKDLRPAFAKLLDVLEPKAAEKKEAPETLSSNA